MPQMLVLPKATKPCLRWIGELFFFSAAMLAAPGAARAQGTDAKERAAQAQAACLSGDHAKGVSILAELYVRTRNPIYIFNQGRCFEQSGKCEDAIVRFREYQRKKANAGHAPDPLAEEHITECQALLDKQRLAAQAAPPPAAVANTVPPVPVIPPAGPDTSPSPAQPAAGALPAAGPVPTDIAANRADLVQTAPSASQAQPEGSIFGRWWFWTAVGAVVAGGVTTALLLSRGGGGGAKVICTDCADSAEVNPQ